MFLIIQIPAFNEEGSLAQTLAGLPRHMPGVDAIEYLVIDDGSTDRTRDVAAAAGAHHIISHQRNEGLAKAFMTGLEASLKLGADVIVNIDADNQYCADDIPALIAPIQEKRAEIVVGARAIDSIDGFSPLKKLLQKVGSAVVRLVSNTQVPDAPSGFRAMTREAALRLNVFSGFTYTLETIIQAGQKKIAIASVPVRTNPVTRPSRLVSSTWSYIRQSLATILRILVIYRPFRIFATIGACILALGVLLGARFLWFYVIDGGRGHVQSVILCSILLIVGFQTILFAFVTDVISANRKLLEEIQYKLRKLDLDR